MLDRCLKDLFIAFTEIEDRYFDNRAIRVRDNELYSQGVENSITAELYHRFRNKMDNICIPNFYRGLILQFDINKINIGRPDLVLHGSQRTRQNHILFLEAKITLDPTDNDLINKIRNSISNEDERHLNYKHVVIMLYCENDFENQTNRFLTHFDDPRLLRKIVFIGRDQNGNYNIKKGR
jgi:hypothetical protein